MIRLNRYCLHWFFRPVRFRESVGLRQFVVRILAQFLAAKFLAGILLAIAVPHDLLGPDPTIAKLDPIVVIVAALIAAPILETLICQTATVGIARVCRARHAVQFAAASLPFAAIHFAGGIASGVAAGVVGGIFFAHTYLECRQDSLWKASWVTASLHAAHNLVVLPLIFFA